MDFWRGEAYSAFFEYLDSHGGFYYEVNSSLSPVSARNKILNCPDCMYHMK